jgi:predicted  nucleic acid-binding Zn-ribbon protein
MNGNLKMNGAKQLYQLQDIDIELESNERSLEQTTSQIGESKAVARARARLESEQQRLKDLGQQQNSAVWEIDDLTAKITTDEETLYSGKVKNPKELSNLQQEVNAMKAKRDQLENKTLEIMDLAETAATSVANTHSELKALEAEWHSQQQQLSADMERLKAKISDLNHKRQLLAAEIDPQTLELYSELKKQKGTAVARVEQGICRGCLISLPITEVQKARSNNLVRCHSCGRILFLA